MSAPFGTVEKLTKTISVSVFCSEAYFKMNKVYSKTKKQGNKSNLCLLKERNMNSEGEPLCVSVSLRDVTLTVQVACVLICSRKNCGKKKIIQVRLIIVV